MFAGHFMKNMHNCLRITRWIFESGADVSQVSVSRPSKIIQNSKFLKSLSSGVFQTLFKKIAEKLKFLVLVEISLKKVESYLTLKIRPTKIKKKNIWNR